jgi:methionyl-tRNA formyltransferase
MRIAFFGSPAAALPFLEKLLESSHDVALIVTQPDRPSGRGKSTSAPPVKRFALDHGIRVLQPARVRGDAGFLEALRSTNPDINVVVAYGQILPASVIYLPPRKSVNVHFSLLPQYRGAAPVEWAILNGERRTGITVFELDEKMDEGDILAHEEVEIRPGETAGQLEARLARAGASLLVATLDKIDSLPRLPQDHRLATLAPRLKKEQGRIDWAIDAGQIEKRVRAFCPWPGAFTFWRGQRLIIHAGRPAPPGGPCGSPGRVVAAGASGVTVCCGNGSAYIIERLQRENKKALDAADFLRGTKITPGDDLG